MSWKNGNALLQPGDVLVIDEAGMVGTRQMARFIKEAQRSGAKLVLVGDPEQFNPSMPERHFAISPNKSIQRN